MNWPVVIQELKARGFSQLEVAKQCGTSQATVSELSRGVTKSPSYELGAKLIQLHQQAAVSDSTTQQASNAN